MGVANWFSTFCSQLRIGAELRSSIANRAARMVGRLNSDFRGVDSPSANRFYVGSYGRSTAIPSVSDVDLLYELPVSYYTQYNAYAGNGQSALLSTVRASLQNTYPTSAIAGDGQVIVIEFTDGIKFEILPAFTNTAGGFTFADTNGGGSWKACMPKQEMLAFSARNLGCAGNLIELSRMARAWRDCNSVSMSGMLIDTLAFQFMGSWTYRETSFLNYDQLTRDFFGFLANQPSEKNYWTAPGSGSWVYGGGFQYKARQAELRSIEALGHQLLGQDSSAKMKYRDIYGTAFPR